MQNVQTRLLNYTIKKTKKKDDNELITHRCYEQLRKTHIKNKKEDENTNQNQEDENKKKDENTNQKEVKQNWEVVIKDNPTEYDTLKQIFPKSKFEEGDIVYYENLLVKIIELDTRNLEHLVKFVDEKEITINKKDLKQIVKREQKSFFSSKTKYSNEKIDVDPNNLQEKGVYKYNEQVVKPIVCSGDHCRIRFSDTINVYEDQLKEPVKDNLYELENGNPNAGKRKSRRKRKSKKGKRSRKARKSRRKSNRRRGRR